MFLIVTPGKWFLEFGWHDGVLFSFNGGLVQDEVELAEMNVDVGPRKILARNPREEKVDGIEVVVPGFDVRHLWYAALVSPGDGLLEHFLPALVMNQSCEILDNWLPFCTHSA